MRHLALLHELKEKTHKLHVSLLFHAFCLQQVLFPRIMLLELRTFSQGMKGEETSVSGFKVLLIDMVGLW